MRRGPRGRRSHLWRIGIGAALLVVVSTAVAGTLISTAQASRQASIAQRFDARQANASRFIEAYIAQVLVHEERLAERELSGKVESSAFDAIVAHSQFNAAVLLEARGRLLAVNPMNPALLGTQVGARYAHLRSALAGIPAVSDVVPSASQQEPVIGFAVPFDTSTGRRVFSGAYTITDTPLQPFITSALSSYRTAHVYLTDSAGIVISADQHEAVGLPLSRVAAPLAAGIAAQASGFMDGDRQHFVSGKIAGTPWLLVFSLDSAELFQSYTLAQRWTPWVVLALFLVLGLGTVALLVRYLERSGRAEDEYASQRAILDTAGDAYVGMDSAGRVIDWNTAACRLLGWTRAEAMGQPVSTVMIPPRDRDTHTNSLHEFLVTGVERLPRHPITVTAQHLDGHEIPVELTVSRSHWQDTWRFHAFVRDISDRLEHEKQMRELALTDSLTGLANHRAFLERLNQAHARSRRLGKALVVLYADVDHFKHINDTHGHAAGDAILRDVADRLVGQFRTEDTVGRLGGDEFAVVCEDFSGDLDDLAGRLYEVLSAPYSFRGEPILATVSIGHAIANPQESAERLLERADATMYQAKAASRS